MQSLVALVALGCASPPAVAPADESYRSLAEVVAVLESGTGADLYRFDPPTDVTGENLFRASAARLERYRQLLPDPAFEPSIAFALARARERLFDFAGAAALYEQVAAGASPLATRAARLGTFARRMADVLAHEPAEGGADDLLLRLAQQRVLLRGIAAELGDDPRAALVEVAIERQDVREREFLWRVRALGRNGTEVALDAARQVALDHAESRRRHEHALRLADMYAELARGYVSAVDPAGHDFDAAYALNLIQAAARTYAEVAAVDGRPEREEARAQLAALEGLSERLGGSLR